MKKGSLLLQRPVRTFEEEPDLGVEQVDPIPTSPDRLQPGPPEELKDTKVRTLTPRNEATSPADASEKFGPLTIDLAKAKKREPKGLLTTTVPSLLHGRLMQREEGPSGLARVYRTHGEKKPLRSHEWSCVATVLRSLQQTRL